MLVSFLLDLCYYQVHFFATFYFARCRFCFNLEWTICCLVAIRIASIYQIHMCEKLKSIFAMQSEVDCEGLNVSHIKSHFPAGNQVRATVINISLAHTFIMSINLLQYRDGCSSSLLFRFRLSVAICAAETARLRSILVIILSSA